MSAFEPSNERLVDRGLGGRLDMREARWGGCGKASMLTVFLSVLCGVGRADAAAACVVAIVGTDGED